MSVLTVVFWDVQHGSAALLETPNRKHIAIDLGTGSYGGEGDAEFSPLLHLKNNWKVSFLDAVVVTHPHRDHLDDILNFRQLAPTLLLRPSHLTEDEIRAGNRQADNEIIDEYLEINRQYTGGIGAGQNPFDPANNGGVQFSHFTPTSCATSNLNNQSIVVVASYASLKILIPGDNEPPSWNELLERADFCEAIKGTDVLLAPHHGRDSGFSPDLFDHISPRLTVISDGDFCDTSATDRYATKTRGWTVHKRSGGNDLRKCVTTRNDGVIVVKLGNNNGSPFLEVNID